MKDPENPDADEIRMLRRRDAYFLFRLALRVGVAILIGVWLLLWLPEQPIGGCAAQGFQQITDPK